MDSQMLTSLISTQQVPPEATMQQAEINQRAAIILSAVKVLG